VSAGRSRGSDRLVTAARESTREQRVAASRLVLRKARNRDDLRLLLDALGLNDQTTEGES
jgi:hypothetical protein